MSYLPINRKETQTLKYLYHHSSEYISSQKLGDAVSVSDRTARKYVSNLNQSIEEYGAVIESKKGHGYRLLIQDEFKFHSLLEMIDLKKHDVTDVLSISGASDRERYLLNKIFLENQLLTVDEFAAELFVSRTTIMHDLHKIKLLLEKYDLTLSNSVNDGIAVMGPEVEKRRFILNYFFETDRINYFMEFNHSQLDEMGVSIETLFIIVLEECRNAEIQLSDYVMQNLVLHLALAIVRIKVGETIEAFRSNEVVVFDQEEEIANRIVERIEKAADIKFPKDEAKYIALHLKAKSNKSDIESFSPNPNVLRHQILQVLTWMKQETDLAFKLDGELLNGLEAHFEPLITRMKMGIPLNNPLYEEVHGQYKGIFNQTKAAFKEMPLLQSYEINNHEWAYITLHMLASVERFKQSQRLRIVVICSTGMGSAQMLRNRLENEFGRNIQIVDVISYYQLNDERLEEVDLIISTIDISVSFFSIPIFRVSVFLNEDDIGKINQYIKHKDQGRSELVHEEMSQPNSEAAHLFDAYFSAERFIVVGQPITRAILLEEMVGRLTDCQDAAFVGDFIKHIELRERFGSLAFSDVVAFPHPSVPLGYHSEIVMALVPDGVKWDEGHEAVKIVILMSPSKVSNKDLDKVTEYFVTLVESLEEQELLLSDQSFEQLRESFMKNYYA